MANDLGRILCLDLPGLHRDTRTAAVPAAVANLIDVGFVLSRRDELVRIIGIAGRVDRSTPLAKPCQWFDLLLERGYNDTSPLDHEAGAWEVAHTPEYRWAE